MNPKIRAVVFTTTTLMDIWGFLQALVGKRHGPTVSLEKNTWRLGSFCFFRSKKKNYNYKYHGLANYPLYPG